MTLYELVQNTTIQSDVDIIPMDKDGNELDHFHTDFTEDLAYAGWPDDWEDYEVVYIYVSPSTHNLVIEIREQEEE